MHRRVLAGGALLLIAGGFLVLVLWLGGVFDRGGSRTLTRAEYLVRVQRLCREADRKLAGIPPPASLSNPEVVSASIDVSYRSSGATSPRERRIEPPPELAAQMDRAFELSDQSVRDLEETRRRALAADTRGAFRAMARFLDSRDRARAAARAAGLRC
jgi:hypothetical protein